MTPAGPQTSGGPTEGRAAEEQQAAERLARVALRPVGPDAYFSLFLEELERLAPFRAAAVWGMNQQGVVERIAERTGAAPPRPEAADPRRRIVRVIDALSGDAPRVEPSPEGEPDPLTTLLAPLRSGDRPVGVVEVLVDPGAADTEATLGLMNRLVRVAAGYVERVTRPSQPEKPAPPPGDLATAVAALHRSLDPEATALAVVNEGRRLLGCDRLSLALFRRGRARLVATSGRERVARRAESVVALTEIAQLAYDSRTTGRFGEGADPGDDPLGESLARHATQSGARRVEALPLTPTEATHNDESPSDPPPPCAVLLAEQFTADKPFVFVAAGAPFTEHAALAVANAQRHGRLAASLPGRLLGKLYSPQDRAAARRAGWWVAACVAALALLAWAPTPYRVEARGVLIPTARSVVFAPSDAEVEHVAVEGGQHVRQGDLLLRLSSPRLESELLTLENQLRLQEQALAALVSEQGARRPGGDQAAGVRLQGRLAQARIEVAGLTTRLAELRRERERLEVRAPQEGSVATFDPQLLLGERPVSRGEALLEVMDFDGPWRLRLDCPTDRAGHLLRAADSAPVEFVLASAPEQTMRAVVTRHANRVTTTPSGATVLLVEARVEPFGPGGPGVEQAGGEVVARIGCGDKPLAYVLFGGVHDALRRCFW